MKFEYLIFSIPQLIEKKRQSDDALKLVSAYDIELMVWAELGSQGWELLPFQRHDQNYMAKRVLEEKAKKGK